MPVLARPCADEHPDPALTPECPACHRALHSRAYRIKWGLEAAPAVVAPRQSPAADCRHLGAETGEQVRCGPCGGNVRVKLRACAAHGQCSTHKALPGVACCQGCNEREEAPPHPFPGPVTRHLVYYVAPASGSGSWVWRENLRQLLRRASLFNGRRLVAVAVGGPLLRQKRDDGSITTVPLEPADAVRKALAGRGFEVVEVPHDPGLREVSGLAPLLERVASDSPSECVFVAHAKGVTHPVNPGVSVHRWSEVCYETCLDYWPLVERHLSRYVLTGPFKKLGNYWFGPNISSRYHHSGAFYWLRSARLTAANWRGMDRHWAGAETYPDRVCAPEDAGCLFLERSGVVDLYQWPFFKAEIEPAYAQWRLDHAQDRRDWP